MRAVFENAATLTPNSPVRIAGVNVGEVTAVNELGDQAEVTFTVSEEGQPIHEDATIEIRPRLFLEGNFFLDLEPGSPSAPELGDGESLPVTQTAIAVQLDQVLDALDQPTRADLRDLLEGYGTRSPTSPPPPRTPTRTRRARRDRGEGDQRLVHLRRRRRQVTRRSPTPRCSAPSRTTSPASSRRQANSPPRCATPGENLPDLISNFNTTAGAFADESANLSETIRLLAPTLEEATPALQATRRARCPRSAALRSSRRPASRSCRRRSASARRG